MQSEQANHELPAVAVLSHPKHSERCKYFSSLLHIPLCDAEADWSSFDYQLVVDEQALRLLPAGKSTDGPVFVDFAGGAAAYRRKSGGGELISKAIAGPKATTRVWDATAGLGRDSFVIASSGYRVTLCERSPLVACLLEDALQRASGSDDSELAAVIARMQLCIGNSTEQLMSLRAEQAPEVIVIDPMFPSSKKSALVKKEMRVFQQLIGADSDSDHLLEAALHCASHRVVVKRPKKAQFLADKKPNFSLPGKAIRFDVYTKKSFG